MSKKKIGEIAAEVKKDRLNKHLDKVERLIERWIPELLSPSPFYWHGSTGVEDYVCEAPMIYLGEFWELRPWQMWVCCDVYKPPLEEEEDSNHMLRKHLRSRALWKYHTEWEGRLNGMGELAAAVREKAVAMQKERGFESGLTKGHRDEELCRTFSLVSVRSLARDLHSDILTYFRRSDSGIWYYPRGCWVGGRPGGPDPSLGHKMIEEHWEMIHELQYCSEMLELAKGWQRVLELQERMQGIAGMALKSSDIFHPCQFCRKLW